MTAHQPGDAMLGPERPMTVIALNSLAVGQHVWMDTRHPVWPRGWITYSNHRVIGVLHYNTGSLHSVVLEAWHGAPRRVVVEARLIELIKLYAQPRRDHG